MRIKKDFGRFVLDVAFEAGDETVALLGASGCGKSMTLKCIAGIVRPDEGEIVVNGETLFDSRRKINLPPRQRHVGLLFQNYALFPNMTVEENILSVLSIGGAKRLARERFRSLAGRFRIAGLENHYPAQLSGGQQQRVALARIMASDPRVIMLDEPLSALDSYLRWQLEGELAHVLEEFAGTTLYVSHNRDEVYRLCKKVCVMSRGRNENVRMVGELFESPDTLASSLLSGCKNYSRIERRGGRVVHAVDWNADLTCASEVPGDAGYIGVRSHYVALCGRGGEENALACRIERVTQDVFGTIVNLRPEGTTSAGDFARIRMELPKSEAEGLEAGRLVRICVKPSDIMLLRE